MKIISNYPFSLSLINHGLDKNAIWLPKTKCGAKVIIGM